MKLTPEGDPIWTYPSPVEDGNLHIALNASNDLYIGGDIKEAGSRVAIFKYENLNVTHTEADKQLIQTFLLHQNYPNPFNPSTRIRFEIPEAAQTSLVVHDVRGHEVAWLVQEQRSAGAHEVFWHGVDQAGKKVSTGVYFARLQAGQHSQAIKMLLLK